MQVQAITNQSNNLIQNKNNITSFKGELGAKVMKEITAAGIKDGAGISKVIKSLGIGTFGLISISKLKNILEPFVSRFSNFEEEMKDKENGFRSQELIFEASKNAFQKEMESKRQAFEADKKAQQEKIDSQKQAYENENKSIKNKLNEQMEELAEKEKVLNNVKHILRQGEIDELKSSIMVAYGIKASDVQSYDSAGEQVVQVVDTINKNKKTSSHTGVSVENMNADNIAKLVRTMRNKDGKITSEMLDALRKITAMHDFDVIELIPVMLLFKDDFGEIDFNKMAYFIALYSLNNATINSVAKNLVKEYNMSDKMFIDILKNIDSLSTYSHMSGYANLLSECNVTNMEPKTKESALELINKKLNRINPENANDFGKEVHKILKELAAKLN